MRTMATLYQDAAKKQGGCLCAAMETGRDYPTTEHRKCPAFIIYFNINRLLRKRQEKDRLGQAENDRNVLCALTAGPSKRRCDSHHRRLALTASPAGATSSSFHPLRSHRPRSSLKATGPLSLFLYGIRAAREMKRKVGRTGCSGLLSGGRKGSG